MKIGNWKLEIRFLLFIILIIAAFFRLYGLNWDQGYNLHPDERAIIMAVIPLKFPTSIQESLTPASPLNPHFFAYGNFPMYLLKGFSSVMTFMFNADYGSYGKINIVGRLLSTTADLGTIILIFLISKKIFGKTAGLIASFFYTTAVFPIQASHFFAVDVILTFFITLTLYQLINFYNKPSVKNAVFVGIFFGLSLTTKISAIALVVSIILSIILDFILIFIRQPHKPHVWLPHLPRFLKRLVVEGLIILITTAIVFIISQPYAIIDFSNFMQQNLLQSQMTHNAYIFPYTLQYVGKVHYFYELKNIFLWGLGPFTAAIAFTGVIYCILHFFQKGKKETIAREIIVTTFFLVYFFIVGNFAVGWMRYMLPLYPIFCIFAGFFVYQVFKFIKIKFGNWYLFVVLVFIISIFIWPLSFMNIYSKPNTRVLASEWINTNIAAGKTLAIEHWDDSLPMFGQEKFRMLTLPLYDPDNYYKWQSINQQLSQTDYIIIASNRLYVPLQKLTDCKNLPPNYCYPQTAQYYHKLFKGELGFTKVAEFTIYPKLEIGNWKLEIRDDAADESFTVYDHPKIMIFKKIRI